MTEALIPLPDGSAIPITMDRLSADVEGGIADEATLPATAGYGTIITRAAFRARFDADADELVGIELAAVALPSHDPQQALRAAKCRTFLADLGALSQIDLAKRWARRNVEWLESAGLLAAGRAAQILDTAVEVDEVPDEIRQRMGWR